VATIYLSSTYADLKDHRAAVAATLRKMEHTVVGMEDYVAADVRPLDKCLRDVDRCDVYVGLFAWRCGFVPEGGNADGRSITELEYRRAVELGKPRLVFILHDDAPWPAAAIDAVSGSAKGARQVARLRKELGKERLASFFRTPDDLAREVSVAVYLELRIDEQMTAAMRSVGEGALSRELLDTKRVQFGSTLMPEIDRRLAEAAGRESPELLEVDLGRGRRWWSTRLFLVAALARDFAEGRQIVFLAGRKRFVGLASAPAVARALAAVHPQLASRYAPAADAHSTVFNFSLNAPWYGREGGEQAETLWVTEESLQGWLGDDLVTSRLEERTAEVSTLLAFRVLDRAERFVPIVTPGGLLGVVDRFDFATRIAREVLAERLREV
jgi:hypothetical protein